MTDAAVLAAELEPLWHALAAALRKDDGPGGGGGWESSLPVNADVLSVMVRLRHEIPAAAKGACEAAGEPWRDRDVPSCLRLLPRVTRRLRALNDVTAAEIAEDCLREWVRSAKRALGLRTPDIPVGYVCPHYAADPGAHWRWVDGERVLFEPVLLAAGSEGFLRKSRDGITVEWEHQARVYCPGLGCRAWWGPGEWLLLGKLLKETA